MIQPRPAWSPKWSICNKNQWKTRHRILMELIIFQHWLIEYKLIEQANFWPNSNTSIKNWAIYGRITICYCWAQKCEQHWLTVRHQVLRYTQLGTRCLLHRDIQPDNTMWSPPSGPSLIGQTNKWSGWPALCTTHTSDCELNLLSRAIIRATCGLFCDAVTIALTSSDVAGISHSLRVSPSYEWLWVVMQSFEKCRAGNL